MRISDWSSDVCSSDLDVAALQGLDRQQAVVDRAERGAGADDDGDLPSGEQVGVEGGGRYRNERAAGTFDDQVPGRRDQDFDVAVDTVNFGGAMRRGGGGGAVRLGGARSPLRRRRGGVAARTVTGRRGAGHA